MSTSTTLLILHEAVQRSEETWRSDLHDLFEHAKDRFPDMIWEQDEHDVNAEGPTEVWGHKGASGF